MPPRVVTLAVVLVLLAAAYAGVQLARRALVPSFQSYMVTPTLDEARARGTLLGEYQAEPLAPGAPAATAYADRPTRDVLGPLLRTRPRAAQAARVVARLGPEAETAGLRLAFDDRAGVRLNADGSADPGPFDDGTTDASDRVSCCVAFRARPPERFWLERDGERVVAFTLDERTARR